MNRLSRISITLDSPNHVLLIRFFSLREASDKAPDLIDYLDTVGKPWLYHAILDFRRYEAELSSEYTQFLLDKWLALEAGRDVRRALAVITRDPWLKERLKPLATVLPHRNLAFFSTFDEGLDWVKSCNLPTAA